MSPNLYIIIFCLCFSACSSAPKLVVKTSKHPRVIQYEPAVSAQVPSFYQFEDINHYYAFSLLPHEQQAAASIFAKITTNPEQQLEINYYQSGDQACLKSLKVEDKTFEMLDVTRRCDLYVSMEKSEANYNHLRFSKLRLTSAQIKKFLKKNPALKKYERLIRIQAVTPGMPVSLLVFIWGTPESKFTDEEGITLFTYADWYVSIKGNKIFSFSSRDFIP